ILTPALSGFEGMTCDISSRPDALPSFIRCSIIVNPNLLSPLPLFPCLFGKLYFHHSRTYLQEPALRPARRHEVMSDRNSPFFARNALIAASALVLSPLGALGQSAPAPASSAQSTVSASKVRCLHVRAI